MDLKLEVVPIPVTDVDAAKAFHTDGVQSPSRTSIQQR